MSCTAIDTRRVTRIEIATARGPVSALVWEEAGTTAPWLHFAHATGMNAQLYARLLEPLSDRFRIVASDARGHGRTDLPADPAALGSWQIFAADLDALLATVAPEARWLLAGHSMGASVSALLAARQPSRAARLVLADPAAVPFGVAAAFDAARRSGSSLPNPMAEQAARRRPDFGSTAEARAAYAGRGMFAAWSDADLDAYLAGGLRLLPDGGVRLACTPAFEAATFSSVTTELEPALVALRCAFVVVAAETGSTVHDADLATIAALPHCLSALRVVPSTHFVPLEAPAEIYAAIVRVAAAA